jgi:hypothetical protein
MSVFSPQLALKMGMASVIYDPQRREKHGKT